MEECMQDYCSAQKVDMIIVYEDADIFDALIKHLLIVNKSVVTCISADNTYMIVDDRILMLVERTKICDSYSADGILLTFDFEDLKISELNKLDNIIDEDDIFCIGIKELIL